MGTINGTQTVALLLFAFWHMRGYQRDGLLDQDSDTRGGWRVWFFVEYDMKLKSQQRKDFPFLSFSLPFFFALPPFTSCETIAYYDLSRPTL